MANLKDHQQAMVDLLASGSGIPASASRLAHAMHDVLSVMLGDKKESFAEEMTRLCNERIEATTPGLNDKALVGDIEACRPKDTMFDRARAAERRVKELEDTVKQLRASNAKLKSQYNSCFKALEEATTDCQNMQYQIDCLRGEPEQAGCRKDDTQDAEPQWVSWSGGECPLPAGAIVEVKFYDRQTERGSKAGAYVWRHGALGVRDLDIIAYRVLNK